MSVTTESARADALSAQEFELARLIVDTLKLDLDAAQVSPTAPLYGEGLGLDSIDVLELVLEIERSFGVTIGDEQTGMKVLGSVDTIADFIVTERAKRPA